MATGRTDTSKSWDEVIRLIPGYDPFRDAGDCVFDQNRAALACGFFEDCVTHVKGEWARRPLILQPWQRAVIGNLFGWLRPDGTRRYRQALIYIPRKNSKTTMASGLALYMLVCDGEPGAEIYCAAKEREQAKQLFDTARGMVEQEPALLQRLRPMKYTIQMREGLSFFKCLSHEAKSKHGFNIHCGILDELHCYDDRDLVEAITTGTGSRRQPLVVGLTTADCARESICNEMYDYACMVRDGVNPDPYYLPVIYEAPKDADWTDPATWAIANPNMGVSFRPSYLEEACNKAKANPREENGFKRFHLNIRTAQVNAWLRMDSWDACRAEIDPESLKGQRCFAGLDLAQTQDLSAFVLVFPRKDGTRIVLPYFWLPEARVKEAAETGRIPYVMWVNQGFLKQTRGKVVDYDLIRAEINLLRRRYKVVEIAFDRYNATQLATQLSDDGAEMVMFGQGFVSMSAPAKELEALILNQRLKHDGHPVLRWNAQNVSIDEDKAANIKPIKPPRETGLKVDGIVALCMALGRVMVDEGGESCYDQRGLLQL